jgi:hypothetical protein
MSTYTFQGDDTVAVDTFISKNNPTTNFGTHVQLQIGEGNNGVDYVARALMRLDLTSIPASSIQNSGVLSLWTIASGHDYADNSATVSVYKVNGGGGTGFVEGEATWNKKNASNNWATAGCSNVPSDRTSGVLATASWPNNLAGSTEVQITFAANALEQFFGSTIDIIIQTDLELNDLYIFHSSSSTTAANRPKLVVDYSSKLMGNSMILGV